MDKNNAAFVGSIPDFYDRGLGPVIFEDYAAQMALSVAEASPSVILETAAGTGIVTEALRRCLPKASKITATDLNAPMLDVARGKLGLDRGVEFQTADAQQLPFVENAFDAVVSVRHNVLSGSRALIQRGASGPETWWTVSLQRLGRSSLQ